MAWWERHYTEPHEDAFASVRRWQGPPPATRVLLVIHAIAFFVMLASRWDAPESPLLNWGLSQESLHAIAILVHPVSHAGWSIVITIWATWLLGSHVERRRGTRELLRLYVLGNLAAGAAYWLVARGAPHLAAYPLDFPAGALAAWCATAWRYGRFEQGNVFGRLMTHRQMATLGAGIIVALTLLSRGNGAWAWVLCVAAAGLMSPVAAAIPVVRFRRGASTTRSPRPGPRASSSATRRTAAEADIDDILAKISRDGIGALSEEERARLESARQALLHHPPQVKSR
jgi:membrane associated rhomboid family serine protease